MHQKSSLNCVQIHFKIEKKIAKITKNKDIKGKAVDFGPKNDDHQACHGRHAKKIFL